MIQPQIIIPDSGLHNSNPTLSRDRLVRGSTYRDLSTICLIPSLGSIPTRVVQSWFGLMTAMNQKFIRMFLVGMEVSDAYSQAIEMILANPDLSKWRYVLTLEEDNIPPPNGLLELYESIEGRVDGQKYSAVGGLYWTKGPGGQPMIYGDPYETPLNFVPQVPRPGAVQRCNGLGMGFTLFRMSMLADKRLERPLFKTEQTFIPGKGVRVYTQDLHFFEKAGKWGYTFACDTRVAVGHYDSTSDIVW